MSNDPAMTLEEQIIQSAKNSFVPYAVYDQHMDYIRIELRDCSTFERRLSEQWTLAFDNYPEDGQYPIVGIVIKGIKHLFTKLGLPLEGVYQVADLLDEVVKLFPVDEDAHKAIQQVQQLATNIEMPVSLAA